MNRLLVTFLALSVSLAPIAAGAQDRPATKEALVKAAMVYNFIRFIEWPNRVEDPRVVCSYVGSELATALSSIDGKPVGSSSIKTEKLGDTSPVTQCDVIVLSSSDEQRFYTRGVSLDSDNILTVGDSRNFARQGGVIGFTERDGRIGFEVNIDQANARGLTFSSRLLRLAEIVSSE